MNHRRHVRGCSDLPHGRQLQRVRKQLPGTPQDTGCLRSMTFDAANNVCQVAAACPTGGSLDPTDARCEAVIACETGYIFNAAQQACEANPVCPLGGTYRVDTNLCRSGDPISDCAYPFVMDTVNNVCQVAANCPTGGTLDTGDDRAKRVTGAARSIARCWISVSIRKPPRARRPSWLTTTMPNLYADPGMPVDTLLNTASDMCEQAPPAHRLELQRDDNVCWARRAHLYGTYVYNAKPGGARPIRTPARPDPCGSVTACAWSPHRPSAVGSQFPCMVWTTTPPARRLYPGFGGNAA